MLSAIISALRGIKNEPHAQDASPTDQVTDPVTDPVSPQVLKLLLHLDKIQESNTEKLMLALKIKHRPTFRANYLKPALQQKLIQLTQPDTPNSPTQKYKLTATGSSYLK